MLHSRTITFGRGFTCLGGLRVYRYASVLTATWGKSFSISAATALTKCSSDPAGLPSAASTAAQRAQRQLPAQIHYLLLVELGKRSYHPDSLARGTGHRRFEVLEKRCRSIGEGIGP